MRAEHAELWQRIESFSFDDGAPALSFERRLGRENGWPLSYTRRAVREYKRFVFLAMAAGHPVCPSEQVDQAWHLHLTYTRSYWERFCRGVLDRPLHHDPTRGGSDEHKKHTAMYEATLASYRQLFDEEPPPDIWPDSATRFTRDIHHRKVNTRLNWVIPKCWARRATAVLIGPPLLLAVTVAARPLFAVANPWNLAGPEFLQLYAILAATAVVMGLLVRIWVMVSDDKPDANFTTLDPFEVALLARGKRMAINSGIAGLVHGKQVELVAEQSGAVFKTTTYSLRRVADAGNTTSSLQREILDAISSSAITKFKDVHERVDPAADAAERQLEESGFLLPPEKRFLARVVPCGIITLLTLLGISKVVIGIGRGKPIEYLILACALTGALAFLFLWGVRRTPAGRRAVQYWKGQAMGLQWDARDPSRLSPADVAMAVAVLGIATLPATAYGDLRKALNAPVNAGGGGGGCGSGCGGGAGCGGGGCGGCGGD